MATIGRLVTIEAPERLVELPDPLLFVLNHNNSFESVIVPSKLIWHRSGRIVVFMIDWMFLHIPVVGWIMRLCDPIPVYTKPARFRVGEGYRQQRRRLSPVDAAVDRLAAGQSVGVFPEGTRNRDPHTLLPARSGLVHIVLRSDVPVLPVGIEYPSARRLGRIPSVGRMRVRIGEPLDFTEVRRTVRSSGRTELDGARFPEARRIVADAVMSALAPLCGKVYDPPQRSGRSAASAPSEETRDETV
jgi:1-acyl-sn-glycerol-3-phosphate acyltransferase